ncbi:MAG: hypothetical protein ACK2UJ_07285, partial [Candidatus Promineifilaceae bacterium]
MLETSAGDSLLGGNILRNTTAVKEMRFSSAITIALYIEDITIKYRYGPPINTLLLSYRRLIGAPHLSGTMDRQENHIKVSELSLLWPDGRPTPTWYVS